MLNRIGFCYESRGIVFCKFSVDSTLLKTLKGMFLLFRTNTYYSIFTVKISSSTVAAWAVAAANSSFWWCEFKKPRIDSTSTHYYPKIDIFMSDLVHATKKLLNSIPCSCPNQAIYWLIHFKRKRSYNKTWLFIPRQHIFNKLSKKWWLHKVSFLFK